MSTQTDDAPTAQTANAMDSLSPPASTSPSEPTFSTPADKREAVSKHSPSPSSNKTSSSDGVSVGEPELNIDSCLSWSINDVCAWLKSVGLEEHIAAFQTNKIRGEVRGFTFFFFFLLRKYFFFELFTVFIFPLLHLYIMLLYFFFLSVCLFCF